MTLSIPQKLEKEVRRRPYIKWTQIARDAIKKEVIELKQKEIFEKYTKKQPISKEEYAFMKEIDWHPVDELPIKESYAKKLKEIEKEPTKKIALEELFD
jgi:hypothetical protein